MEEEEQISKIAKHVNENLNVHFLDRGADIAFVRKIKQQKNPTVYRNSKELAGENKSSAYILLPVGTLGIIALVLIWFDVIPLYSGLTSKIITSVVMGSLFVVFIVMGVLSLKNAKKLDAEAAKEGDIFLTVTGDKHVVDIEHIMTMKDGAFLCNAGHFDHEVNVPDLKPMATEIKRIRPI